MAKTMRDRVIDAFNGLEIDVHTINLGDNTPEGNNLLNVVTRQYSAKIKEADTDVDAQRVANTAFQLFKDKDTASDAYSEAAIYISQEQFKRRQSNLPEEYRNAVSVTVSNWNDADKFEGNADAMSVYSFYLGFKHGVIKGPDGGEFKPSVYDASPQSKRSEFLSYILREVFGIFGPEASARKNYQRITRTLLAGYFLYDEERKATLSKAIEDWKTDGVICDFIHSQRTKTWTLRVHPSVMDEKFTDNTGLVPVDGLKREGVYFSVARLNINAVAAYKPAKPTAQTAAAPAASAPAAAPTTPQPAVGEDQPEDESATTPTPEQRDEAAKEAAAAAGRIGAQVGTGRGKPDELPSHKAIRELSLYFIKRTEEVKNSGKLPSKTERELVDDLFIQLKYFTEVCAETAARIEANTKSTKSKSKKSA